MKTFRPLYLALALIGTGASAQTQAHMLSQVSKLAGATPPSGLAADAAETFLERVAGRRDEQQTIRLLPNARS